MNPPRMPSMRLFGLALLLAAVAACTSAPPAAPANSLPVEVIVNDPAAEAFPDDSEAPPAPEPVVEEPPVAGTPVPAVLYGDVMQRIRSNLSLPDTDHQRIDREIEWLQRNPDYVARVFERARLYLHYIVNEVEARNLPGDLALLPVVESAFNPFAYSRSAASGLWQFIAPTGDRYGMQRNYWKDERRDVVDSTAGALEFLQHLNERFAGNWYLAIAAYNYGSGNIQRAINRNLALRRKTDFFSLSLPAETRAYVPKLIALARIVRNPEAYGIYLPPIPDQPYFRVVPTDGPVDLRKMAVLAGIESVELHTLNAAWNRWLTDPDGPHRVLVPERVADSFTSALAALDPSARAGLTLHPVTAGESVASIAGQYKVPESFIERMNVGKVLQPGEQLLVPGGDTSQLRAGLGSDMERRTYRVKNGDSLWSISRKHGMTVAQLARLNGISTQAMIQPGQRLQVSGSRASSESQPVASGKVDYRVKNGDTLSEIARRFAVTVRQLQNWNNMGRNTMLRAGQRLTIHVGS